MTAFVPDGEEFPVCMACADEEPCVVDRCAGQGRENSATGIELNVFGEVFDVGTVTEVVHRTPEELGLARTVPDVPPPAATRRATSVDWEPKRDRSTMSARKLHRDGVSTMSVTARAARPVPAHEPEDVPEQTIRGVRVRVPANACMGAEMLDGLAQEAAREGGEMGRGKWLDDATKQAIVEASDKATRDEVARKFDVSPKTVSTLRMKAGRKANPRGRTARSDSKGVPRSIGASRVPPSALSVVIDPKRPGTASALLDALARQDAARVSGGGEELVKLELTHAQLAAIVSGLAPNQVAQMIAVGLPAALAMTRG